MSTSSPRPFTLHVPDAEIAELLAAVSAGEPWSAALERLLLGRPYGFELRGWLQIRRRRRDQCKLRYTPRGDDRHAQRHRAPERIADQRRTFDSERIHRGDHIPPGGLLAGFDPRLAEAGEIDRHGPVPGRGHGFQVLRPRRAVRHPRVNQQHRRPIAGLVVRKDHPRINSAAVPSVAGSPPISSVVTLDSRHASRS